MERERVDDGKGVVGAAVDGDAVAGVAGNDAADGDDAAVAAELTAEPPVGLPAGPPVVTVEDAAAGPCAALVAAVRQ